jgi:outer membrane biosynthesis protein TonB
MESMNRPFYGSLFVSLALHVLVIGGSGLGGWHGTRPIPVVPEPPAIEFEFVDSPNEEMEQLEDTSRVSERDSVAHDLVPSEESVLPEPAQNVTEEEPVRSIENQLAEETKPEAEVLPEKEAQKEVQKEEPRPQPEELHMASITMTQADVFQEAEKEPAPEEQPVPSVQGDIIQRAISAPDAGVDRQGAVSYNARSHDMGAYISVLKRKIWLQWFPQVEFNYRPVVAKGKTVVGFKVLADGGIADVEVVSHDGNEYLEVIAFNAVLKAAPFEALPGDFESIDGEDVLDVLFTFYYY